MAEKSTMENKVSPVLAAPPTVFPYPEKKPEDKDRIGKESRTSNTLNDGIHHEPIPQPRPSHTDPPTADSETALKRARTELGARRRNWSLLGIGKQGNRRKRQRVNEDDEEGSSDSESSLEDEPLRRSWSQPNYPERTLPRLNKIQTASSRPHFGTFSLGVDDNQSTGKMGPDGRLDISVTENPNSNYLARALGFTLKHGPLVHAHDHIDEKPDVEPSETPVEPASIGSRHKVPRLNIVIMVIGSRGDIQPFLKIGKILKEKHGHRVRIASHPVFKEFVEKDIGLEFFSVGGDPSELMAFMVKNPGLIPSIETVRAGEIGRRRDAMQKMFQGFWRACINATDDEKDIANINLMDKRQPFIADAIIANPPSFAHFHCAERLSIPLHLVFTFPYTPTQKFPHPLANIQSSNVDTAYTNFMSYPLVELMVWQGLGDLVNLFRVKSLGLEPMSTLWAPGQLSRLKVPYTYLWSPALVPKPRDWGPEIDIAGYVFLDLASDYHPPERLSKFLESGEAPIYIGFGSISGVHDPDGFTRMVFEAVEKAGVRALISKGWGEMGKGMEIPDHILLLDNVPHDWLFPKVAAVVHHGGAGTTAAGLKCGKPTMIIPFFGDQPFWGAMIAKSGAGAKECLPLKKLTVDSFAEGIRQCLTDEARAHAQKLADDIIKEGDGADNAVASFHRSLSNTTHSLRCAIFEDRAAVWTCKRTSLRLSALAAELLVQSGRVQWRELRLIRHNEWHDFMGPGEPVTGAGGAFVTGMVEAVKGIASIRGRARKGLRHRDREIRRKKKMTVASAVALAGEFVHRRTNLSVPPADRIENQIMDEMEEVNLHGQAAPLNCHIQAIAPKSTTLTPETWGLTANWAALEHSHRNDVPNPHSVPVIILKATGQGLGHTAKALAKVQIDVWYAATLGLHNAPRLYGDHTVRPASGSITGFRTSLAIAGSNLGHGIADGCTGLVRLPRAGREDDPKRGLIKGIVKGVGGFFLKPAAGCAGLIGYPAKGVEVSLRKRVRDTGRTERWIRKARTTQGQKEVWDLARLDEAGGEATVDGQPLVNGDNDHKVSRLDAAKEEVLRFWTTHLGSPEHQALQKAAEKGGKNGCPN